LKSDLVNLVIDAKTSITNMAYRLLRVAAYVVIGALLVLAIEILAGIAVNAANGSDVLGVIEKAQGPLFGLLASYAVLIIMLDAIRRLHVNYLVKKSEALVSLLKRSSGAAPLSRIKTLVPELKDADLGTVIDFISVVNAVLLLTRHGGYIRLKRHMISGEYYLVLQEGGETAEAETAPQVSVSAPPPPPQPGGPEGETRVFEPDVEE